MSNKNDIKSVEERIVLYNTEKQLKSRKERTTAGFYDAEYWGKDYQQRFGTNYEEDDKQVQFEVEKKVNFIKRYMPNIESVLDVACSFGFLTAKLRDDGLDAWGIDISCPALDKAPERVKPYLKEMNVKDMSEFKDNRFELVTAFDILEHLYIEEIIEAVKEIDRVARKFIVVRLPVPSLTAEPWVADMTAWGIDKEHVSNYPWEFWAKRFEKSGKFKWWFVYLWNFGGRDETCEGWIAFRSKK